MTTTTKYSFWWDFSPPDFAYQSQLPSQADVVIIGAGFAGLSTAYWLAYYARQRKKQYRIIVLDEAQYAGFKSSGRTLGNIYVGSSKPASVVADRIGTSKAKQLFHYSAMNNKLLHQSIKAGAVPCNAEFNGGIRMATSPKETIALEDSCELLHKWGFYPIQFNADQSHSLVAVMPHITSSIFVPNEGMIDPFALVSEMARGLRRHNVWVVYGARVIHSSNLDSHGPAIQLDNGHVITAGKIVHANHKTIPDSDIKDDITVRREHVIRTEPFMYEAHRSDRDQIKLDEILPQMPIEINMGADSARIHEQSLIMMGGKAELGKDTELSVTNDSYLNRRIRDHLSSTMRKHFPFTNQMDISHEWTYIQSESSDGLPIMGELPNLNGHYVNVAHGKNRLGLAFLGAKNIAEKVLRIKMTNPEFKIFSPERLSRSE